MIDSLRTHDDLAEEETELLQEILVRWDHCNDLAEERKGVLGGALEHIANFEKSLADVNDFIDTSETQLAEFDSIPLSNVGVVDDMIEKHKVISFGNLFFALIQIKSILAA